MGFPGKSFLGRNHMDHIVNRSRALSYTLKVDEVDEK
jgi:hypothetical protein